MRVVVARHHALLLRYAAHQLGDADRAHDVVQECFLRLWDGRDDLAQDEHVRRWLYVVCRNLCADQRRAAGRADRAVHTLRAVPREVQPDASGGAIAREVLAAFLAAWAELPADQREVTRLKLQSDLTYRDIAEVTGLSVSNVGYLLHHAMTTLRAVVEADDPETGRRVM